MIKRSVNVSTAIGSSIAVSLIVAGCAPQTPQATGPAAVPVKLQTLGTDKLVQSSEFVGTLIAQQRVSVSPQITGRIRSIFVKSGDQVTQGQKIAELDPEQQQQQVNAGIGQVNSAKANLNASEADLRQRQAQARANKAQIAQNRANVANAEANVKSQIATLSAAEADLQRARANLDLAEKNLKRAEFLVKQGAQPQQDLDDRRRDIQAAKAEVEARSQNRDAARQQVTAARATLQANKEALNIAIQNELASQQQVAAAAATVNSRQAAVASTEGQLGATRQNLVFNTITAPIAGFVGDFNQRKVGDIISLGEELTSLTNNKTLELNVQIPVELQPRLRVGLPVEIINPDGSAGVRGQVTFISPTVSQATQSVLVKFAFTNDGSLRNNQYVRTRLIWDQKPGVLIPTTAVTSIGAQNFVFVAEKEKAKEGQENAKERLVVRQKPIQVGTIQGQAYQVISGVNAGERIAVNNILSLRDGTAITVSQQ
jgi:RND family efflux transporter MFP subunit